MVEETRSIVKYQSLGGALVSIDYQEVLLLQPAATPAECNLFLAACQGSRLNPHLKEIFLVPFGGPNGGCSIHIGVWGHLKIAQQHSDYRGFEAGVIVRVKDSGELVNKRTELVDDEREVLYGGWAQVGREDWLTAPIEVKVDTYTRTAQGDRNRWNRDPAGMIRKVALSKALGETYPLAQEPPPTEGVVLREWTDEDEEKLSDLYPMNPQPDNSAARDALAEKAMPPRQFTGDPWVEGAAATPGGMAWSEDRADDALRAHIAEAEETTEPVDEKGIRDYALRKGLGNLGPRQLDIQVNLALGGRIGWFFQQGNTMGDARGKIDVWAAATGKKPPKPEPSTEPAPGPRPAPEGAPADTLTDADFV